MKVFKTAEIGTLIDIIRTVEFRRTRVGRHERMWDIEHKARYPKCSL